MSLSSETLRSLLNDVSCPDVTPKHLHNVFYTVFKDLGTPKVSSLGKWVSHDNLFAHQQILSAISQNPRWDSRYSFQQAFLWALQMPRHNGVLNDTTTNALVDVLRRMPADVAQEMIGLEKTAFSAMGLNTVPFVVALQLRNSLGENTAPTALERKL